MNISVLRARAVELGRAILANGGRLGPVPSGDAFIAVDAVDISAFPERFRDEMVAALMVMVAGHSVTVGASYRKQTETKARVADRDYTALPGVSPQALMGRLSVFRTKAGALRLRILTPFRSSDGTNGWASLIPAGLRDFRIVSVVPASAPVA